MYFTGPYLRVTTPRTTNGIIPKMNNGEQETREDFLPLSARKALESKNTRLEKRGFRHLKMKIEVVGDRPPEPVNTVKSKRK